MSLTFQTKAGLRDVLIGLESLNISLRVVLLCWTLPCITALMKKLMFTARLMRYQEILHHAHKSLHLGPFQSVSADALEILLH
jgi:hypothetical protein